MPEKIQSRVLVVVAGACASLGLMLYAGRHNPSIVLRLLFAIWVLSPFAAALLRPRGSNLVPLILALGSVAVYTYVAVVRPVAKMGFPFLVVPLAGWLLLGIAAAAARNPRA